MAQAGALFVVTGIGGAGKGTVVDELRRRHPDLWWSVSWATRDPRPGEVDGEHYWFVSRERFEELIRAGGFLEWAEVYGVLKGTPKQPVVDALARGDDVLLETDIQGALAVKRLFPDAVVVFLTAEADEQRRRLEHRATDTPDDVARRLAAAADEEAQARAAGFVVLANDEVDRTVDQVTAILKARREPA